MKRIHLVTDDGLYDWKAFYKVEIVFLPPMCVILFDVFNQCFLVQLQK